MASVFLSYDHDDAAKAQSIALALEKAGHSVWWDLHIRSGAQFSKVIEQSLKAANVIVVLWSKDAVESPWVRDEAAAGRDSGRLVPVTLDGTEPPLGFRQFQTIDFTKWKGRRKSREVQILLADIDTMSAAGPMQADVPAAPRPVASRSRFDRQYRYFLPLSVALALLLAATAYWLLTGDGPAQTRVVVTATEASAKPMAQQLLLDLSKLRSAEEGSLQLLANTGRKRPDLLIKASGGSGDGQFDLTLMKGNDAAILWSKQFSRDRGSLADLRQRMAYSAGEVLGCAVEGLGPDGEALPTQALKLYLAGCSQLSEGSSESIGSIIPIFQQVIKEAPRFKPAWAKLLLAESTGLSDPLSQKSSLPGNLRRHITEARQVDPAMPEATLAEAALLPSRAFGKINRLMDQAKESSPGNPVVLATRSQALAKVGRMNEAIEDAKEAARLEPTSPEALHNYILSLAYGGRIDAAREELQRAERLWSDTERFEELQYAFQLRFGDPKEMVKSEKFRESNPRMQLYFRTRADPTPANVDGFMAFLQGLYARRGLTVYDVVGHSQAFGELGREKELYELIFRLPANADLSPISEVVFRPALRKFRQDPRFMIVAKRAGFLDYWRSSGMWPDFCFDPDQPYDCKAEAAKLG